MADIPSMKMASAALIFLLFSVSSSMGAMNELRNVHWGMNRFEVMASEELSPETFDAYYVHYKTELEGREQDLIYGFFENRLVDAVYVVTVLKADEYLTFKKNLERRYGKAVDVKDRGKGDYLFVWENRDTRVLLRPGRLKECRIEYISKKYKYLKDREAREALARREKELNWTY